MKYRDMDGSRRRGITIRVVILIALTVLLVGIVAWKNYRSKVDNETEAATETIAATETEGQTGELAETEETGAEEESVVGFNIGIDESEGPEDTEAADGTGTEEPEADDAEGETRASEEYAVTVTNAEEFAKWTMGGRTNLLSKYLSEWVEKKGIAATEATILNAAVQDGSSSITEYYAELNNKKGTLVTLAYDPYEVTVTVSKCQYTKDEILNQVWEAGVTGIKDVSEDANAEFLYGTGGDEEEAQGAGTEGVG